MQMQFGKKTGSDAKFFSTNRKGENHELREELRSPKWERKRDAVKKVIANMTVGKDVSSLFPDVINCIQTDNLELKKLVYLYLINYAKSQPDMALMAVNTFVKDANDSNPLIRALAIRTMGCIRVEKITEYLCEPLTRALRDEDPYVRKTAAICVAKLYDISPELVEDRGYLGTLHELLADANPTVVANAVAALGEIAETSGKEVLNITAAVLQKLLAALNECTEWGQVFILDCLSKYTPTDAREAEGIIERVTPRLQHANSSVVMSAVKVILKYMEEITNQETVRTLSRKLAPPLVTLLNAEPEIQYVALRNINLIVQKRPRVLEHEIKVFFCKYNDPIYVKMEKLEIIIRLASERNIDQVLLEFKEYATEVDVDFVRRAVRAIGRCAINLDRAAERCINVLLDLIQTKVNYVVQEAIVVIKDIFRKYPNKYENIIGTLCENLEDLDEPEAKASMIWIIGEYAERIDNADELLESFLESFNEETSQVQLQLLTATVKLFLKSPESNQEMVQRVLTMATEDSDNPDLRDRGYIYWRLLSSDPEAARAVVLSEKPEIADDTFTLDAGLLDELISNISTLASVYHKPAEAFIMKHINITVSDEVEENEENNNNGDDSGVPDILNLGDNNTNTNVPKQSTVSNNNNNLLDLLDDEITPTPTNISNTTTTNTSTTVSNKPKWIGAEQGHGVFINGLMVKRNGAITLEMDIGNTSSTPISQLAIQFNKNSFGLTPSNVQINLPNPVLNGNYATTSLVVTCTPAMLNNTDVNLNLQVAVKNVTTNVVFYFAIPISMEALFASNATMEVSALGNAWKGMDDTLAASQVVNDIPNTDVEIIKSKLTPYDISFVFNREIPGQDGQRALYFYCRTLTNVNFIIEILLKTGMKVAKVTVKSPSKPYNELCKQTIAKLITK